jgi:hypothetical protein
MAKQVFLIYIIFVLVSLRDTLFYTLQHEKIIPAHNFDFIKQIPCKFWGFRSAAVM